MVSLSGKDLFFPIKLELFDDDNEFHVYIFSSYFDYFPLKISISAKLKKIVHKLDL